MDVTGDPDGEPQKVGVAICDLFTGLYGVDRDRGGADRTRAHRARPADRPCSPRHDGRDARQPGDELSGFRRRRLDAWATSIPTSRPTRPFPSPTAVLIVAVGNDGQFARLCATLGLDALAEDPRFATNAARVARQRELERELTAKTRLWRRDDLIAALETAVVPRGADQHGRRPVRRSAVRGARHADRPARDARAFAARSS